MKILFIYATYSTGTLTMAEHAIEYLKEMGQNEIKLLRADKVQGVDIMDNDLIFMASPSWMVQKKDGMPHEFYLGMMDRLKGQTFAKKFAVISLGDESYAKVCGSAPHLVEFVQQLGGTLIGEPLCLEGFYFAKDKRLQELKDWLPTVVNA
jgi:flavodoxin